MVQVFLHATSHKHEVLLEDVPAKLEDDGTPDPDCCQLRSAGIGLRRNSSNTKDCAADLRFRALGEPHKARAVMHDFTCPPFRRHRARAKVWTLLQMTSSIQRTPAKEPDSAPFHSGTHKRNRQGGRLACGGVNFCLSLPPS